MPTDSVHVWSRGDRFEQPIPESLVIALVMIVTDEFREGPAELALADRYDPTEALLFD